MARPVTSRPEVCSPSILPPNGLARCAMPHFRLQRQLSDRREVRDYHGCQALRAIRQAEVGASQTMIERTGGLLGIKTTWARSRHRYGSAANLDWLVNQQGSHACAGHRHPSVRTAHLTGGLHLREMRDGLYMPAADVARRAMSQRSRASLSRLRAGVPRLPLKAKCCRTCRRDGSSATLNGAARDAPACFAKTKPSRIAPLSQKVEMLFAHLKRILRL